MIVMGREETPEIVAKFKADRSFDFPVAADPERATFNAYASERIPRTYIISRDGKIVYQSVGFLPDETGKLREMVVRQLGTP